jgi:hypothetical protein
VTFGDNSPALARRARLAYAGRAMSAVCCSPEQPERE